MGVSLQLRLYYNFLYSDSVILSFTQVQHLSSCPVDPEYLRSSDCPLGFTFFKNNCYRLSSQEKTFAEAEVDCSNGNGEIMIDDKD